MRPRSGVAMGIDEFRAKVAGHLAEAARRIPDAVPNDVFDECVAPMMDELQALDDFLYGLGADERRQEDQERARERTLATKAAIPDIEQRVMMLDERAQKMVQVISGGSDGSKQTYARCVTPMYVDMLVLAFIRLLDAVPAESFADDRLVPPDFPSGKDKTVAGIVELMRDRKAAAV